MTMLSLAFILVLGFICFGKRRGSKLLVLSDVTGITALALVACLVGNAALGKERLVIDKETKQRMALTADQGWLKIYAADREYFGRHMCHCSMGNDMSQIRRALLEHKRGGRDALLKYHTNPTKYTPDRYLQARVDAAKRAIDERHVRLAANPDNKGILALTDPGGLVGQKGRWYGDRYREADGSGWPTKWGAAYYEYLQDKRVYEGKGGSVAWYQWQVVYDAMLADGKISADAAARGGRGLQGVATHICLDSWDAFGEWLMACHELENHFAVPIGEK